MSLSNLLHCMRSLRVGRRTALTLTLALLAFAPSLAKNGTMSGTGTESSPYLIEDMADWNKFAENVLNGETYIDEFIMLGADIGTEQSPVTAKIGDYSQGKVFSGTFDGDKHTITVSIEDVDNPGTALFGFIDGATIKNLTVAGNVVGGKHAAGLVGESRGTGNRIENSVVSATVNGSTYVAGILGHGLDSDISIDNCVFKGKLVGGSKAKGVFFGWGDNGGTKTVSNCLYIQQNGQDENNLDLVRMYAGIVTATDCYKTADVGMYGMLVYLTSPADILTEERIAADDTKFYARKISLPGSGSESDPYIVSDADQWNEFAEFVNIGFTFAGTFITLGADIGTEQSPVTAKIGDYSQGKVFSGTFDGDKHTITASIEDVDNPGTALFGYIDGATIRNLTVAGNVVGGKHAAGLVGESRGTGNRIENSVVSATVNGSTYVAGILGHGLDSDISIDNCVFKGKLVGGSKAKGVFFGWGDNGGTKTVSNCLYIQQNGQDENNLDLVRMYAGNVTVADCYKTVDVGAYGTMAYLTVSENSLVVRKIASDGTPYYIVTDIPQISSGSYRVSSEITVNERILVNGDVTLVFDKGKTLNAKKGIELFDGSKLTIDGKGTLNATGDENFAGIEVGEVGTLVIENGIINATGGRYGAGIGGGRGGAGGNITINGGTVISTGGSYGAGIGGGREGSGGSITVNGGTVTSTGGIHAAGIGGGRGGSGGSITINGGTVFSTGGESNLSGGGGSGIGSGLKGSGGAITITGGKVTAFAGTGASGIGRGCEASASGTITLGWTNYDDFIYASSYGDVSSINFVENKYFYFTEDDGNVYGATVENIGGKKILPVTNELDILKLSVSGIQPYYLYTGKDTTIVYDVFGLDGQKLVKGTDYTESFDKYPINDRGVYTLTIMAKEKSGYTGSNSIKFTVADALPVTMFTTALIERYGISAYEVSDDVIVEERIVVSGNVRLILNEGKTLIAKRGIEVSEGNALTIEGKGTLDAKGGNNQAGIGGGKNGSGGSITVNGGTVTSTGGSLGAGIGGGYNGSGGTITINGGTVISTGGDNAAGIGGGDRGSGGTITINGGTVISTGGDNAAGIGGGDSGSGGSITINGGSVTSTGGIHAAGIGGGDSGSGGSITINGGTVFSTGGESSSILSRGGGSGIGGGKNGSGGSISITGGKVSAFAGRNASGIGSGYKGSGGTMMLGWTNDDDFIYASNYNNISSLNFVENKQFYYTENGVNKIASIGDVGGKTIYPYNGEKSLKSATITGIKPYYYYTEKDISIAYTVVDYNGKTLVKGTDYTETFSQWPIKNKGEYTLTVTAKEGSGYTDSKTIRFTVDGDGFLVTDETIEMVNGVYKVLSDVTIEKRIIIKGDVVLVLDKGKTLIAQEGIEVSEGNALTIEGRGGLEAKGGSGKAGIGGGNKDFGGTIIINGGTVISIGGRYASGIGGGRKVSCGSITINGGTVISTGGPDASGIGGESSGSGCSITITGGKVSAIAGSNASGIGPENGGSGGTVMLGWTNDDDFIYASNYNNISSLNFAENKQFYYTENGVNKIASIGDVGGKTIYPYNGEKSLKSATISGIKPYYYYTEKDISIAYTVVDYNGKTLVKGTDYTETFSQWPIKNKGEYSLTITAKEGSGYTDSKTIRFTVDGFLVTDKTLEMVNGVYKVLSDVTIEKRIIIKGDVVLVLDKGKTLTAKKGIEVAEGNALTIEGEGMLDAKGSGAMAGIGGGEGGSGGNITINGGLVTSTGGRYGAGIGGGEGGSGGNITINGGLVTSTGGSGSIAAGIGGGYEGSGGNITINGGLVTSTGGGFAAGIGGGDKGSAGSITINGGTVTSTGGSDGAGIGGGDEGSGGNITITGGKVTAYAGKRAFGIGPGNGGTGGTVMLGWTNDDDFIYASNYSNVSSLNFVENKQFYYTEKGVNKVASIDDIAGKELHPYIGKHNLKNASISDIEPSYTYTGEAIIPSFKIVDFNGQEMSKDDYAVSIEKNGVVTSAINVGEYTMVFTGKGNYEGTKEVKFSIVPEVVHNYAAVQVLKDEKGTRAEIDGEYSGTDAVNITEDIENVAVTFNRNFTVDLEKGGFSTLMLPFRVSTEDVGGLGGVYKFAYVADCDGDKKNDVCINKVWEDSDTKHQTLEAYTPYMVRMKESTLKINTNVTLEATTGGTLYDKRAETDKERENSWQMRGVFGYKEWKCNDGELGKVWGYTGEPRNGAKIGKYMKFGKDVWINPFRAYLFDPNGEQLKCTDNSAPQSIAASPYAKAYTAEFLPAPARSDASATASSEVASIDGFGGMQVVVVDDDNSVGGKGTTVIGRLNPATGEIRMQPRVKQTYDLKGRRVNGEKKNARGAYYNKR